MANDKGRSEEQLQGITKLGDQKTNYVFEYDPEQLEFFENQHGDVDYLVNLECFEFTSLCPKTGQPDFATVYIRYIPEKMMVESKSLKLFLFSFRNHGDFHEDCMNKIMKVLWEKMQPRFIEVHGIFSPRGGIAIHPYTNMALDKPMFNRELGETYKDFAMKRLHESSLEADRLGRHFR